MEETFSFDHLNPTEFENFCYELLSEIGFINLNWRKGTGYETSPSDDGRDIECEYERNDIDGTKYLEKWFVDAKHYKKGIPVSAIRNTLDWAEAERPDFVLIIGSNFLSNSTKRFLEKYKSNNNPSFKIKHWENPDIEKLTLNKRSLLKKYKIPDLNFTFLNLMHPAHLWYINEPPLNNFNYFFNLIENLEEEKRDKIFFETYHTIVYPRFRKPTNRKEKLKDLMLDDVNYDTFKEKVLSLEDLIVEPFLIECIVNFTLRRLFNFGDMTTMQETIQKNEGFLEYLVKIRSGELTPTHNLKRTDDELNEAIKHHQQYIQDIPKRTEEYYKLYTFFCEEIVSELFKQKALEVIGTLPDIENL